MSIDKTLRFTQSRGFFYYQKSLSKLTRYCEG